MVSKIYFINEVSPCDLKVIDFLLSTLKMCLTQILVSFDTSMKLLPCDLKVIDFLASTFLIESSDTNINQTQYVLNIDTTLTHVIIFNHYLFFR